MEIYTEYRKRQRGERGKKYPRISIREVHRIKCLEFQTIEASVRVQHNKCKDPIASHVITEFQNTGNRNKILKSSQMEN